MSRWVRLAAAVVAMMMIANLQYAWTLFVDPIRAATHWKLTQVQWGFTLFVAFETWAMPCSGWLIDRLGPRVFLSFAGILCGVGWAAHRPRHHPHRALSFLFASRPRRRAGLLRVHRHRPQMVPRQARSRRRPDLRGIRLWRRAIRHTHRAHPSHAGLSSGVPLYRNRAGRPHRARRAVPRQSRQSRRRRARHAPKFASTARISIRSRCSPPRISTSCSRWR